jgi:rod shape-determining protein MreD
MISRSPRLGRNPSSFRQRGTPILSVMLGSSLGALLPVIAQWPSIPPLGLLVLIAWRLLHPELWPLWIGIPLGAFDDIMSGQPLGMSMCLWSITLMGIEALDQRIMWRSYWHDWALVGLALLLCLGGALLLNNMGGSRTSFLLVMPQIFWSTLTYPLIVRLVARLDRWRIMA